MAKEVNDKVMVKREPYQAKKSGNEQAEYMVECDFGLWKGQKAKLVSAEFDKHDKARSYRLVDGIFAGQDQLELVVRKETKNNKEENHYFIGNVIDGIYYEMELRPKGKSDASVLEVILQKPSI